MKAKILIVEDEPGLRRFILEAISLEDRHVEGVGSAEEAIKRLETKKFDIVLTDINLNGKSGLDLLPVCRQIDPNIYLLVMTGYGTIETAVEAMKLGANDFLCKPIALDALLSAITVAVEKVNKPKIYTTSIKTSPIIAKSNLMLDLLEQVEVIAPFKLNVLITGETGTGKELIAKSIHQTSPRAENSFIAINCAAIPDHLLEDELFGHVRGAFTGANTDRIGRFEQASKGTLFLDEIGEMNLGSQAKLLRVLQESEFERVGSGKTVKVDVRIVAATSADLEKKIAEGTFRADLYHRLNVIHLNVAPLRERQEDILPIALGLLKNFCISSGLPTKTIADETVQTLISYNFPGNVRQLQNCMERAAVFSGKLSQIELEHLPNEIRDEQNLFQNPTFKSSETSIPDEGIDFSGIVSQVERKILLKTLDKTNGNKMQAAKLLNMKRTTLVEKIKRLQIEDIESQVDLIAVS